METQCLVKCYKNINWSSCLLKRTVSSCVCKMSFFFTSETTVIGIVVGKGCFMNLCFWFLLNIAVVSISTTKVY